MNRFFVEDIGPDRATITGEDLKHLSAVLRLKKGDKVMLSDGKGSECQGEIERVEPGRAQVKTGPWRPCVSEPHHKLTLFQCLPKAGKMEVILQKCTELGMNALVPTLSARCVVQPGKDFDKKLQRYRKVAREAAMQSHRGWIPEVLPLGEADQPESGHGGAPRPPHRPVHRARGRVRTGGGTEPGAEGRPAGVPGASHPQD